MFSTAILVVSLIIAVVALYREQQHVAHQHALICQEIALNRKAIRTLFQQAQPLFEVVPDIANYPRLVCAGQNNASPTPVVVHPAALSP